jgi:S-adenosylmethionine-dependent methyltransferase
MTPSAAERFDSQPSCYAEYLRTPLGMLRMELSWRNLEAQLPRPSSPSPRALDLGAGTGELALRLAALGWSVTAVDGSPRMLERARQSAAAGAQITFRTLDLDGGKLEESLGGGYDLVVCHDVLEYLASPHALLREVHEVLAPRGRLSLVFRNRGGEVMKRLLRGANPEAVLEVRASRSVREEMYGLDVWLFDPGEIRRLLADAGLDIIAERGVRVASDHVRGWAEGGPEAFERMLRDELRLGECPELVPVARYVQTIAARGRG